MFIPALISSHNSNDTKNMISWNQHIQFDNNYLLTTLVIAMVFMYGEELYRVAVRSLRI